MAPHPLFHEQNVWVLRRVLFLLTPEDLDRLKVLSRSVLLRFRAAETLHGDFYEAATRMLLPCLPEEGLLFHWEDLYRHYVRRPHFEKLLARQREIAAVLAAD